METQNETNGTETGFSPPLAQIEKPYAYHKPSDDGLDRINKIREAYSNLDRTLQSLCPGSRQRSEAITCLETSAMWAVKAVVFNDPKSEVTHQ